MSTALGEAGPAAGYGRPRQRKGHSKTYRAWTPWLMLSPALIMIVVFVLYPAINAVKLSFTDTNLLNVNAQQFVGFANFKSIFTQSDFYVALRHTLIWTVGCVGGQLVLGMIGALALNQRIRARGAVRGIVLLPWATSSVLVSLMWGWMLDPNFGIINRLLQLIGLQDPTNPTAWLASPDTALATLMVVDIWAGVPFFVVMILASLQGVPGELLEATRVDGASAWQAFWRVVLPLIAPAVLITTVLRIIWTSNYFDLIVVLTNGGPVNATLTLPLFSYQTAYGSFDFGKATAISMVQSAILAVLAIWYVLRVRKRELL